MLTKLILFVLLSPLYATHVEASAIPVLDTALENSVSKSSDYQNYLSSRRKFECQFYLHNTTIHASDYPDITQPTRVHSVQSKALKYLFGTDIETYMPFYLYTENSDRYYQYETEDNGELKVIPIPRFQTLKPKGYLVPDSFNLTDELKHQPASYLNMPVDGEYSLSSMKHSIEVPDSSVVCLELDRLQTPDELEKRRSKDSPKPVFIQEYQNSRIYSAIIPYSVLFLLSCFFPKMAFDSPDVRRIVFVLPLFLILKASMQLLVSRLEHNKALTIFVTIISALIIIFTNLVITFIVTYRHNQRPEVESSSEALLIMALWVVSSIYEITRLVEAGSLDELQFIKHIPQLLLLQISKCGNVNFGRGILDFGQCSMFVLYMANYLLTAFVNFFSMRTRHHRIHSLAWTIGGAIWFSGLIFFELYIKCKFDSDLTKLNQSVVNLAYINWSNICLVTILILDFIEDCGVSVGIYNKVKLHFDGSDEE